jgi:Dynamin family
MSLLDEVRTLLDRSLAESTDPSLRGRLTDARRRVDEPLRVAIAGKIKAGKSTLLNALVGEELAATDAGECTRIVTWYADGPTYSVTAHLKGGPPSSARSSGSAAPCRSTSAARPPTSTTSRCVCPAPACASTP